MVNASFFNATSYLKRSFSKKDLSSLSTEIHSLLQISTIRELCFLSNLFLVPKREEAPTCHRLTEIKSACSLPTLQNGKLGINQVYGPARWLYDFYRFKSGLFPHTSIQRSPTFFCFWLPGQAFLLHVSPVRLDNKSKDIYESSLTSDQTALEPRNQDGCVPGQHTANGSNEGRNLASFKIVIETYMPNFTYSKYTKVILKREKNY